MRTRTTSAMAITRGLLIVGGLAVVALASVCCGSSSSDTKPGNTPDAGSQPAVDSGGKGPDGSLAPDSSVPPTDAGSDAMVAAPNGPLWRQRAEAGELAQFTLDEVSVAQDGALEIKSGGGHAGNDPPGAFHGKNFYNGGSYTYAIATSPDHVFPVTFNSVTPSFDVATPPGTWVHVKLQARIANTWTKAYSLGVWAFDKGTVVRHSVDLQADANGDVQTDTLVLTAKADALRIIVVLGTATPGVTPRVRGVAAIATDQNAASPVDSPDATSWGKVLPVPQRSQMVFANGGEVWCSPTSTSMLLAYWSAKLGRTDLLQTVPTAADETYDWIYAGNGNWPFNTAHGAAMGAGELHGFVTRLGAFSQVERLIEADVPVAISISFGPGELTGAPIASTAGHLIVVRGIAANGDIVCNDPAFGSDAQVEVTYKRSELTQAWSHSNGTTYVLWPAGTTLPVDPLGAVY